MIDLVNTGQGSSWLHHVPAGAKLGALPVLAIAVVAIPSAWLIGASAIMVAALFRSAGFSPATLWHQVKPLRWILLILVLFQGLTRDWETATLVTGKLVVTVALASLLTLTTRTSDILDVIERGLRRVPRVDAERVALVFALTLRAIPVVAGLATDVRDAQRARGAGTDVRAYGVPLVVRSLRYSDALGEALVARGLDD
ncbi:MAG TPA: energy-coupling factor transporter transmembrane protein EcfT [Jiangellaceae bacterium]